MTIEEMFYYFDDKYGDEFNWGIIPYRASYFVEELKKEVGDNEPVFQKDICAVARSYSADDVLLLVDDEKVKEFLERQFSDEYL